MNINELGGEGKQTA